MHAYATVLPATAAGIQRYLGSGLIKGIGPVMAERVVARFGVGIMHIIEEPYRLAATRRLGQCPELATLQALNVLATMRALHMFWRRCGLSRFLYQRARQAASAFVVRRPGR